MQEQEEGVEPEKHQVNQPTMSDLFGSDSDDDVDDSIQQDSDSNDDDSDNNNNTFAHFVQPLSETERDCLLLLRCVVTAAAAVVVRSVLGFSL